MLWIRRLFGLYTFIKCEKVYLSEEEIVKTLSDVLEGQRIVGVWEISLWDSLTLTKYFNRGRADFGEFTTMSELVNNILTYQHENYFAINLPYESSSVQDYTKRWLGFEIY